MTLKIYEIHLTLTYPLTFRTSTWTFLQVSQEEFHFMLYEYGAETYPYKLYGDTKVDEMPYQDDPDSLAEDLYKSIPKFSELMPRKSELTDPVAIAKLDDLKKRYQQQDADMLERLRQPSPLLNENWGKSKMEIIAEAKQLKMADERKVQLMKMLEDYDVEATVKRQLKAAQKEREATIKTFLDQGCSVDND